MWFGAADQFIVLVTAWDVNLINRKAVKIIMFYNYLSSDRPAVGDLKMWISIWINFRILIIYEWTCLKCLKLKMTLSSFYFFTHFKLSTLYGKLACSKSPVAIKLARRKRVYQVKVHVSLILKFGILGCFENFDLINLLWFPKNLTLKILIWRSLKIANFIVGQ